MLTKKEIKNLFDMTMKSFPLPCKREYEFGPYPECKTCKSERQKLCPHSPFAKAKGEDNGESQ